MNNSHSTVRSVARSFVINVQRNFGFFPHDVCLITGAPRSGTSALVKWLGEQKEISAFPESRILISAHGFLQEAYRFNNLEKESARIESLARQMVYDYYIGSRLTVGRRLIVDKEPLEPIAFPSKEYGNFLTNVRKLLPSSKLLFALRDPIATIWSMSRRAWGESLTQVTNQRFTLDEYIENWQAIVELVIQYQSEPNTYIVQFGRLIKNPVKESKRIFEFLNIHNGIPFQPRETNEIHFSSSEQEHILTSVRPQLEKLATMGIRDLS